MSQEVKRPLECATVCFAGWVLALFWTNILPISYNVTVDRGNLPQGCHCQRSFILLPCRWQQHVMPKW